MKRIFQTGFLFVLVSLIALAGVLPARAQEKQADTMQLVAEKVKADKKLLVSRNLPLTESEAKVFWPVYEAYQKDLDIINQRIARLVAGYVEAFDADNVTDEKAREMLDEIVSIEKAEGGLKGRYVPKLTAVLTAKKVARYLQIENKIRAVVKYDLAVNIPLVY